MISKLYGIDIDGELYVGTDVVASLMVMISGEESVAKWIDWLVRQIAPLDRWIVFVARQFHGIYDNAITKFSSMSSAIIISIVHNEWYGGNCNILRLVFFVEGSDGFFRWVSTSSHLTCPGDL